MLRRRGAAEAGAIFIKVDRLNGEAKLYGPAPQVMVFDLPEGIDRVFARAHEPEWINADEVDRRLGREVDFDPDLWIVDIEDQLGRSWLDAAEVREFPDSKISSSSITGKLNWRIIKDTRW